MSATSYMAQRQSAKVIRESLAHHLEEVKRSQCDKHGLGFNLDDRFQSFKITLSLNSWLGYYGDSGCSVSISVGDQKVFGSAFLAELNSRLPGLLLAVADRLDAAARASVGAEIAAAEERLAELRRFEAYGCADEAPVAADPLDARVVRRGVGAQFDADAGVPGAEPTDGAL